MLIRYIAPILALAFSTPLGAQITAGQTDDVLYQELFIFQQILTNPPGTYESLPDSADLNFDGIADIEFVSVLSNNPDFVGSTISLNILNTDVEILFDPDSAYVSRLETDAPITATGNWLQVTSAICSFDFIGFAGPVSGGNWYTDLTGFLGFRLDEPDGYRYGWIRIYASTSQDDFTLEVTDFAVEAIVNRLSVPNVITVQVFPNPTADVLFLPVSGPLQIRIFGANGQLVRQEQTTVPTITVSSLPTGWYMLQADTGGKTYSARFYKQ